jgi:NAD+ diphosphatase
MHVTPPALTETTLAFAFVGAKLLIRGNEQAPVVPSLDDVIREMPAGTHHYLGRLQGADCVAIGLPDQAEAPAGFVLTGLRALFLRLPEATLALAARAFQVVEWDRTHRFCGRCGTPTSDKPGERAKLCPACGYVAYPRISPAMMVLVTRDREVLLARANRFPNAMYSALAGFVEPGETIEDCIHREVREEVGIDVKDLQYFASQSWAFPHSLMIAYTARYAGGELRPDPAEIEDVRWFAVDKLPDLPTTVSISRRLIDTTVARLRAQAASNP